MRKKLLIMMTALAMTTAAVPGTAMVTYAEAMDGTENTETTEDVKTEEAKKKAEEEKKKAEEAQRQAEEEARREAEEEAQRQAEEEARREAEEEAQRQAEEEARREAEEEAQRQNEQNEVVSYDITYTWEEKTEEGSIYTCTATAVAQDGTVLTETVEADLEEIPASCEKTGKDTYTAVFENPVFETQVKTVEIPANGHLFAGEPTYTWNDADYTCTATRVCETDGYTETETVAATSEVILEPTSTETGIRRYIAEFTNPAFSAQLDKEEIPAVGKKADNTKKDSNTRKENTVKKTNNTKKANNTQKDSNTKKENNKKEETDKKNDSSKKNGTTVIVKKENVQNQNTTAQTTKTVPVKTGDNTQPILPIAAGTGALAAIAAVLVKFRKNRG